ncbi:hypothetical protein GOODEAATRI_004139, partial [Goodea atripinnis]
DDHKEEELSEMTEQDQMTVSQEDNEEEGEQQKEDEEEEQRSQYGDLAIFKADGDVVKNEIQVMNNLDHANLIQLYAAYESRNDLILVLE